MGAPAGSTGRSSPIFLLPPLVAALTLIAIASTGTEEDRAWREETRAFYLAETGAEQALALLDDEGLEGLLAVPAETRDEVGTRLLEVLVDGEAPRRVRIRVTGTSGLSAARVELVVEKRAGPGGEARYERVFRRAAGIAGAVEGPVASGTMFSRADGRASD